MLGFLKRPRYDKVGKRRPRGHLEPLGWRSRPGAVGPNARELAIAVGEPGFPTIDGPHYIDVLGALHERLAPRWYLEVGVFKGHSLARARGRFVAVDPELRIEPGFFAPRADSHVLQMTSEAFFASGFLERNGIRPDFAFLDGLHHYEALLADFAKTERVAADGATIALHDCLPSSMGMAARDWNPAATTVWAGDVWKTLVILRAARPDLRIRLFDAWPTGLALIDRLDPSNTRLLTEFEQLVARLRDVDLRSFGIDRFYDPLEILPSAEALAP